MENNNEIMNEEVMETTEEIVKASSGNGFKTVAVFGLAMIAGGLACKFIVEPTVTRFKEWRKNRNAVPVDISEDDFEEETEDSEE